MKFQGNPFCGSRIVQCGQTHTHSKTEEQTHTTALVDSFLNFANAAKNYARSRTSTASQMRSALFWHITLRTVVISYRRFGTTRLSHLQG